MSTCCYKEFVNAAEICGGDLAGAWDDTQWSAINSEGGVPTEASGGLNTYYTFLPHGLILTEECSVTFIDPVGEALPTANAHVNGFGTFAYITALQGVATLTSGVGAGDTVNWSYEVVGLEPAQPAVNYNITVTPQPDGVSALVLFEPQAVVDGPYIQWYTNLGGCTSLPGCTGTFAININVTASVVGKGDVVFNLFFWDSYNCF